ncbi:T6SS phospholipase effector Tle1-like catalytic domain-containing protein [Aspergillus lucknowensis]|uniref:T6SS Phospholipase effector Tle1-like catalytic domain-containing protein n=1 Tax=Aspergillus lucknowensis TaxID=176173 RepID=A0ABR4M0F6_9EURO
MAPENLQSNPFHERERASTSSGQPRRLVLCFDGTGNHYQGTEEDTNIVKIYEMLERHIPGQYAYYQPGIGTLTFVRSARGSGGFGVWARFKARLKALLDEGVGVSFVDHVIAGYKFVMRYYSTGDHIYIFGFSRGAYTARFLSEMIHSIGLLSRGNEEMVPFAWDAFSRYQNSRGNDPQTEEDRELARYMQKFKTTFCRPDVGVHFLGLFDCVNSVGQFEIPFFRRSYRYIASPSARHIRHAVSIHERRLKFKPALFHLEPKHRESVDFKEVWFAGNHGDVGGGWPLHKGQKHLLSDIPLNWMIQEVLNLPNSESKLAFITTNVEKVASDESRSLCRDEEPGTEAFHLQRKTNKPHDKLRFGHGGGAISVMLWWILEILPVASRLELENGKWIPRRLPPNFGAARDIPCEATIHPSVYEMLESGILKDFPIPKPGGDNPNLPPGLVRDEERHVQRSNGAS